MIWALHTIYHTFNTPDTYVPFIIICICFKCIAGTYFADGTLWAFTKTLLFDSTWISLQGLSETIFSVRACSNAHVLLTSIPGVYTQDEYVKL